MLRNMEKTFGLFNSQRVLLKLINSGLSREEAYDMVQPLAMRAWEEERPFRDLVSETSGILNHLSDADIDDAFDPAYHIRHVDEIFSRAGL
jgi:adenylosuccinate lyase